MLFDIFSGFEGAQYTIEGASYTADELKEKQEEFTPQNAKKQLIELIKERETQERECGSKTPILFQDRDDRAVFIKNYTDGMTGLVVGNAFLIALSMQEYGLARELAGRVRMEDGSFCYFDENSPVNWTGLSIKTVNLLEAILKKGRLPEDIRVFLIESMIKQSKATDGFYKRVQWPIGSQEECLSWSKELLYLKKYPKLYEKLMTEEFICSYLWRVAAWYDAVNGAEKKLIIKKIKPITEKLQSVEAMWNIVRCDKMMTCDFDGEWQKAGSYMELWKKVSACPIVLSVKEDVLWNVCMQAKENLYESYPCSNFIATVVEHADYILDADSLSRKKLFEYFFHEGQEAILFTALKKNLLTKTMMPAAMSFAEKNNQGWAIPMLIMKMHGEFAEAEHEQ